MGFVSTKWRANPWPSELKQTKIPPNITSFYVFRPFWPLKPFKTTLKEVLEVVLEVLEVVLMFFWKAPVHRADRFS